jgi:hypothetical protein
MLNQNKRPRNLRLSTGKLTSSLLNVYPFGYSCVGKRKSQKPKTRSPKLANSREACSNSFRQSI